MAQKKSGVSSTSKNPTAVEIQEWYAKNKANVELYVRAKDSIHKLRDVTKSS